MAEDEFLISILLKAIDEASPTLAKIAAEIKALKEAAGGDVRSGEATPTAQLAQDIQDVGAAAQSTDSKVRGVRQEWEATGRSVRSVSRDMGEYTSSTQKAVSANDALEKQLDSIAQKLQKQMDLAKQNNAMSPDQQRAVAEYARELEAGSSKLDQHSDSYQRYVDLAVQAKQAVVDERVEMGLSREALRQVSQSRLDDVRATQDQIDAAGQLRDRINEVSSGYEDFVGRIRDGRVDVDGATLGYQQMSRSLRGLSQDFPAASNEAIRFAQAARVASDEALRLTALATSDAAGGGGGIGRGGLRSILFGGGGGIPFVGGVPFTAGLGSIGAMIGLGTEHLLGAGAAVIGSGVSALGGGALLGGAALSTTAVGAGSEMAVTRSTIADTQALAASMTAVTNAVTQYGPKSAQAAQATRALNAQIKELGNTAGVRAEVGLAKASNALNAYWDKATSSARVTAVGIMEQFVTLAHGYVGKIADAANSNLKTIDEVLNKSGFMKFISSSNFGGKFFTDMEDNFKRRLPDAVHAFTQALELAMKIIDYVTTHFLTGGFTESVNDFFTKWNSPEKWGAVKKEVDKLIKTFDDWKNLIRDAGHDLRLLFSDGAGEGTKIVVALDDILKKWGKWEESVKGSAWLKTFFENRWKELQSIASALTILASGIVTVYAATQPLVPVLTALVKGIGDLLRFVIGLTNGIPILHQTVLILMGSFLLLWRALDFSRAVSSFRVLGGIFRGLVGAIIAPQKALEDLGKRLTETWAAFKGGEGIAGRFKSAWGTLTGKTASAATPATEMYDAMVSGGAEAAGAIRLAFSESIPGIAGAGALGGAESIPAGFIRNESGLIVPVAEGAVGVAGAEGAVATAGAVGAPETLGASLLIAGGIAAGIAILSGSGSDNISGTGLARSLGSVSTVTSPSARITAPRLGIVDRGLAPNQAETNKNLDTLVKGLNGVKSASDLSEKQLHRFYALTGLILKTGDITEPMRKSVKALRDTLDPVNLEIQRMSSAWTSMFQGVNTTTSTAGQQAQQTLQVLGGALDVARSRFGDTRSGAKLMADDLSNGLVTIKTNTNLSVPAIAHGIQQINASIRGELAYLGGLNTPAGKTFNRTLGANAIVPNTVVKVNAPSLHLIPGYTSPGIPGSAAGSMQMPRGGGRLIHVAEGGYPEVVLTTDPKHAPRQRQLLAQYLQAAPSVVRGYASGGIAMPPWTGPGGEYRQMGMGALSDVISAASSMLGAAGAAGGGGGGISTKGLSGNLTSIVDEISRQKHWSAADWLRVIQIESGGSMTAKNPHSGAYGIAQFIDGPSEYARYGGNVNTLEGQLVAMGNYVSSRYGTPTAALAHENSSGWYAEGGWPAGVPSMATGGFTSSTQPYSAVSSYLSNLNAISAGGQTLTGGQVQGIQPTSSDINLGINTIQSGLLDTVNNAGKLTKYLATITASGGVIDQLTTAVQNLFTTVSDRITNTALQIRTSYATQTGGAGGIHQVRHAVGTYVAQRRTPVQQDQATLGAYGQEYSALGREQGVVSTGEESALAQLARMLDVHPSELHGKTPLQISQMVDQLPAGTHHRVAASTTRTGGRSVYHPATATRAAYSSRSGGTSTYHPAHTVYSPAAEARRRAEGVLGSYTNLTAQGSTLSDDRAQTLAAMFQQEGTVLSDRMTATSDTLGTTGSGLQTRLTNLQNVGAGAGLHGAQVGLTKSITDNATAQIAQYTSVMKQAEKEGNADLASQAKQQIQQLRSTISTAASTLIQDQFQNVQNTLGTSSSGLQGSSSIMQTLGTLGQGQQGVTITQQLVSNANAQIDQYTTLLKQARASGNASMVAQIQQQIDQLNTSISGYTSQLLQSQVDYFNQESQQAMQKLTNQSTIAGIVGQGVQGLPGVGGGLATTLAAQMQLGVLQQTGSALQGQITGTQSLLGAAQQEGNATLVSQLQTQLDNLNTQLAQNTQAISDQTVAIQTTMVTFTNNMAQFGTSLFGGLSSAVTTMGSLTGGINVPLATSLARAQGGVLQAQQTGLLGELSSFGSQNGISGLDLTGLANNPTGLISALGGLNTTSMMSGMTAAQQTLFQNMINSLVSNVGAIEQNTVQLQTLNGQLQQPQQFSTSAWQTFRTAFFTGMGGLLPSVSSIPHMADGGTVVREGIAHLHPAEVVTPASMVGTGGDTHIHTNITSPTAVYDPVATAHHQAFVFKRAARTR